VNVRYEYIESIVHLDAYSSSLICGVNGRLIGMGQPFFTSC
jgi:hypothetical protein